MIHANIILLSGRQGSGKTTVGAGLVERFKRIGCYSYQMKFAEPLYAMHNAVRQILQVAGCDNMPAELIDGPLLQLLGTEWGRKTRGENFWADIAKGRVEKQLWLSDRPATKKPPFIVFDDCRFPNEISVFDGFPRFTVRLEAPEGIRKLRAEKWREATTHPSEISLDNRKDWDMVIDTSDTNAERNVDIIFQAACERFKENV